MPSVKLITRRITAQGVPVRPRAPGLQLRVRGEVRHLKVAVTLWVLLIVTLQVSEVPLHAPDQPAKTTFLLDGLAVRVTVLPVLKLAEHSVPQLMPLGLLLTLPEPLFTTLSVYFDGAGAGAKVAVAVAFAASEKLQAAVPVQAPLQPLNTMPASGVAVRLTAVPISSVAVQALPQSMPLPITLPVPLPDLAALSVNCFLSKSAVT